MWELTVVLDYYEALETFSRIGLVRNYRNLRSYWTTTYIFNNYSRIELTLSANIEFNLSDIRSARTLSGEILDTGKTTLGSSGKHNQHYTPNE